VLFQGLFESYEGVGTVRTVDPQQGIITVLTTPDMLETALAILEHLPEHILWRFATNLHPEERSRYTAALRLSP
jgi:hypothetical protein